MIKNKMEYLNYESIELLGRIADSVEFVQKKQLKDAVLWKKFVSQFGSDADTQDLGWRGEYWGKMMRGACMAYRITCNKPLYDILQNTVVELLSKQDGLGRFSTYSREKEFQGWDMWCRKYILIGMLCFYEICKDSALKAKIMTAICRHADYIVINIGSEEKQKSITATSNCWGGVNSCSILEPFVKLYNLTGQQNYLDFAGYIVETGGCSYGNLIEWALAGDKCPSDYPVNKAYEVMSFFSGLLEYYCVVKEPKYLTAVVDFVKSIKNNEITVIGCAGCSGEQFDNAVIKQVAYSETEMQETCVTVTWMLLCDQLLRLTGQMYYADCIEQSAYNAMLGSVNFENNAGFNLAKRQLTAAMPYDSYSPLCFNRRGKAIGGYKEFDEGSFYGCCASIAAAGTMLLPMTAVMRVSDGLAVNYYMNGTINAKLPDGNPIELSLVTKYPRDGRVKLKIKTSNPQKFALHLRLPGWCGNIRIVSSGIDETVSGGQYYRIDRTWDGECDVELELEMQVNLIELDGKAAVTYGPICLSRDASKESADIHETLRLLKDNLCFEMVEPLAKEQLRMRFKTVDGSSVLLTDYASCARRWWEKDAILTVWMPVEYAKPI